MSKYTTELRYICETEAGLSENVGYSKIKDVIAKAIPKIFEFDFPIFDENYRNVFDFFKIEYGIEKYYAFRIQKKVYCLVLN